MPRKPKLAEVNLLELGDRIQLHPACDWWMRGAKYATIQKFGRKYVHIEFDGGRKTKIHYRDVYEVIEHYAPAAAFGPA